MHSVPRVNDFRNTGFTKLFEASHSFGGVHLYELTESHYDIRPLNVSCCVSNGLSRGIVKVHIGKQEMMMK